MTKLAVLIFGRDQNFSNKSNFGNREKEEATHFGISVLSWIDDPAGTITQEMDREDVVDTWSGKFL